MVELVIKIDENVFTRLFDNGIKDNEIAIDDICEMARALRMGTQLPKGHGRLIDADVLCNYFWDNRSKLYTRKDLQIVIDRIPTIIEADKGENK